MALAAGSDNAVPSEDRRDSFVLPAGDCGLAAETQVPFGCQARPRPKILSHWPLLSFASRPQRPRTGADDPVNHQICGALTFSAVEVPSSSASLTVHGGPQLDGKTNCNSDALGLARRTARQIEKASLLIP